MISGFRKSTTIGIWKLRRGKTGCARIFRYIEGQHTRSVFLTNLLRSGPLPGAIFGVRELKIHDTSPQRLGRAHPAELRVRAVRAGRSIRQPQDQPDGAVSQPGDPRTGAVFAPHVPSLVGDPHDPEEPLGADDG